MSFPFIWMILLIALQALETTSQDNACAEGDFCYYQCHCNNSCQGRQDGFCPDNTKCDNGWFGLRCQYKDLVKGASVTFEPTQRTTAWLTDGIDTTCNTDQNLQSVIISLDREYPLTWLRIVMSDSTLLSTIRVFYSTTDVYQECVNFTWSRLAQGTMDIRCEDKVMMRYMKLGGNIKSLCSLYISGGRNIAYNQTATQSSTYVENSIPFPAELAVDGNTSQDFNKYKSCSHTRENDRGARFDLRFNTAYSVNRFVLYNRDDSATNRILEFRLVTLNVNNYTVDNFKDTSTSSKKVYYIFGNTLNPIISLSVNETKKIEATGPFLTVCELEAFGECPQGKWSLPCTKDCNSSCPTSCHRDDGSCNTVCAGYNNPPKCTNVCISTKWGIDCANDCSTRCFNTSCESKTGLCDSGCLGYSDPPYCTLECSERASWGLNCSEPCSSNCMTNSCNAFNAECDQGCKVGYQLPDCTQECQTGYWGVNCSSKCNDTCYNGECNRINGKCILGCKDGFQFPDCNIACAKGTYGRNCSMNCSLNCMVGQCDAVTGHCTCQIGFQGNACDIQSANTSSAPVGVIVGPIVAGIVLIIIIALIVVIFWRRKNKLVAKTLNTPELNGQPNFVSVESINNGDSVTTKDKNEDVEEKYYNAVPIGESTLIAIESLNSYIHSKGVDFYTKQFEKIPVVKNVTQEVGLSIENKIKNRYKNICPYDHSRVHLEINTERNEMDYINASYILGFDNKVKFIAAQGPQKTTLSDFIRMLWEQKIDVVVMLTDLIEGKKVKCEQYWPDSNKKQVDYIKVKLGSTQVFADYTIRKLELSKKGEISHIFTQFHFTSWPDKGVPSTQWSLVDVEQRVTAINTSKPIVVHCSAGVGRTGTFIALYNIMRQAEETGCVDFFKTVAKLREDRICMVQTVSQYEFLHKAAQVAIACMRTTLNIHDFTDRLKVLEEKHFTGHSKMETEFQGLCAILEKPEEKRLEDELNIYENTDKSKVSGDYEPDHLKESPTKSILFLPGYKHRDEHILVKLPTTKKETEDFWNLVLKYNITLIVSFDVDANEKNSTNYLPITVEEALVFPSIDIKLKESNQKKLWIEQKLNFHSHKKTADASPSNKASPDTITVLRCSAIELEPKTALEILKKARQCNSQTGGIIVYMCSDGISQSGFMAVLTILLDRVDNESLLSIPLIVGTIKSLQPKIIANLDLYKKLYHTVSRHVDTSTQYTNMDLTYYQNANKLSLTKKASEPAAVSGNETLTFTESSADQTNDNLLYANYV